MSTQKTSQKLQQKTDQGHESAMSPEREQGRGLDRRDFLKLGSFAAVSLMSGSAKADDGAGAESSSRVEATVLPYERGIVAPGNQPAVETPNGTTLRLNKVGNVKVGHLIAEEVDHEFAPGLRAKCWGYNGGTPGPTIECIEGDTLRIYVENRLPAPTTVHFHGIILPNGMDGVAGLNQPPIPTGETYVYEFTVKHPGTYMYHPHYDEMTQIALGMQGMLIVHPRRPRGPRVDRDFALMTHEFAIKVGAARPDPNEMTDFSVLTFNSKIYPATAPLMVGLGERVRIRFGNLSPMDHHPIHIHGVSFKTTATDGGYIPAAAQQPDTTVLIPTGSTRVIEFVPEEEGDWAMHCHMIHHVMTQMGHGIPNMIGAKFDRVNKRMRRVDPGYMTMGVEGMGGMGAMDMAIPENSLPMRGGPGPYGYIDMGGMFSVVKVRRDVDAADPDGYYEQPPGTQAGPADPAQAMRDGILLKG